MSRPLAPLRRLQRTRLVALAALAIAGPALAGSSAGAQTTTAVTVRVGQSAVGTAAPGSTITVPVSAEFAAGSGLTLGSLAVRVTWDSTRLALEGVTAGATGSVVTGAARAGEQQISWFDAVGVTSSFTVGSLRLKVLATSGSAGVTVTVRGAGNQLGQSVLARVRAGPPLVLCIGAPDGEMMGDVNGDARADILDAQQVARWSVGLSVADSDRVKRLGDVTADGAVDILDAQQLARFDVGLPAASRIGKSVAGSCAAATQSILMLTPGTQSGPVDSRIVFRVRVVSDAGVPVAGAKVTWEEDGAATLTQTANGDGEATTERTAATVGLVRGVVYVGGKGDGGARVDYSYDVTAAGTVSTVFDLDARFIGDVPPVVQGATARAVARLERAIVKPAVTVSITDLDVGECTDWLTGVTLSADIAGIVTYVKVLPIDGRGGTLARAGPCYVIRASGMPFVAVMEVDSADAVSADSTMLESIVLHELLHGVGIGSLDAWDAMVRNGTSPDPSFSGAVALLGWQAGGGGPLYAGAVPVESSGGQGTAGAHWRESMLGNELMTGFAGPGPTMPFSGVTMGALRDLGYVVDLSTAESYRAPSGTAAADRLPGAEVPTVFDEVLRPRAELLVNGSLRVLGTSRIIPPALRQIRPLP